MRQLACEVADDPEMHTEIATRVLGVFVETASSLRVDLVAAAAAGTPRPTSNGERVASETAASAASRAAGRGFVLADVSMLLPVIAGALGGHDERPFELPLFSSIRELTGQASAFPEGFGPWVRLPALRIWLARGIQRRALDSKACLARTRGYESPRSPLIGLASRGSPVQHCRVRGRRASHQADAAVLDVHGHLGI